MWLKGPQGHRIWLAYGMNVHPGGTLQSFEAAIHDTVLPLRARLGVTGPFGLALRFNADAIHAMDDAVIERIRRLLASHDLVPFTGNAFVLGDFDGRPLKDAVYHPPWSDPARRHYTIRFAEILAAWADAEVAPELSLSTAPGSWRGWEASPGEAGRAAAEMAQCADQLRQLSERTGHDIRLGLEPEPRCTIETTPELISFFSGPLHEALEAYPAAARAHIGVCYDVCHQAVMHEDILASLAAIEAAGIPVVKLQASCALEVPDPQDPAARAALARFDEPTYLHQVAAPDAMGQVHTAMDLGEVLSDADGSWARRAPWRVHFHVPVFRDVATPPLRTTRPELVRALRAIIEAGLTAQIEIETYTWDVLPESERQAGAGGDLVLALAQEYASVLEVLAASGVSRA